MMVARKSANDAEKAERHIPVLLDEVLAALDPKAGETVIDGTFGAGGYTRAILAAGADVIGVDRDPNAIRDGQPLVEAMGGRLTLVQGRFGELDAHAAACGLQAVDGVVLDLGISSMQVDEAERGFSFRHDGPLDMRMEQAGPSAADVVNAMEGRDLARIIGVLGEEKRAGAIARAIVEARKEAPLTRTGQLASLVEKTIGRKPGKAIHPATKTFQGLRIYVNDELGEVVAALGAAERILREGGRLVVVSFHSLEDRIVKRFLADRCRIHSGGSRHMPESEVPPATFTYVVKGAVEPGDAEISRNPRARSARLRAGIRTAAPARTVDTGILGFPAVPAFQTFGG